MTKTDTKIEKGRGSKSGFRRRDILKAAFISGSAAALAAGKTSSAFAASDEDCDALFVLSARGRRASPAQAARD